MFNDLINFSITRSATFVSGMPRIAQKGQNQAVLDAIGSAMALAAAGIGMVVDWMAARLSHWQPERAKRNFAGLFVLVAMARGLKKKHWQYI